MDKRRIAMLSAVCVAVLEMLGLTTRQRLKECEARLKECEARLQECDAQRDGAIHERNVYRRQNQ
jgi:division protein CdvB (Snf7/Vps24/ESCRT-III family)